jgi:hypothetical protein
LEQREQNREIGQNRGHVRASHTIKGIGDQCQN